MCGQLTRCVKSWQTNPEGRSGYNERHMKFFSLRAAVARFPKVLSFVGKQVTGFFLLLAVLGVLLFLTEISFGYCVMVFFARVQPGAPTSSFRLEWVDRLPFLSFILVFCGVVLV